MKNKSRFVRIGITLGICLTLAGGIAVFSEPGGTDDPVVTKSYIVDKVIPDIKAYVDERFGIAASEGVASSRTDSFTVISASFSAVS